MKQVLWVSLLTVLTGCAHPVVTYQFGLTEVERPADAVERYGDSQISLVTEEGVNKQEFEDEFVRIVWAPASDRIAFRLHNKTDHSIRVIWDDAIYVGPEGESHRVMHSGVKYSERNNPQPPSIVARRGMLTDVIIPTSNVKYMSSIGWYLTPLMPLSKAPIHGADAMRRDAERHVGRSFQVILPLAIQDVINEYIFSFEIEGVSVER